MRTNIEIDVALMDEVQRECNLKSKKQAIDLALRSLLRIQHQNSIGQLFGKDATDEDHVDLSLMEVVQRECQLKSTKDAIELGLRSLLRNSRQNSFLQFRGARGTAGDIVWSPASEALFERLGLPAEERAAVNYDRRRLDDYQPNVDFLLPPELAHELLQASTAATARRGISSTEVADLFMMDFIWGGVRLRGNSFSRHGARNLLSTKDRRNDSDTIDVLNHWAVHEGLIAGWDATELACEKIRSIQARHVYGHFPPEVMDGYRQGVAHIPGCQYSPLSDESMLSELMEALIQKARAIKHPIEATFFLWLHLAYLHPFDAANHRTSRAAMNIPLLKACLVPITFIHVDRIDYQKAMFGFYEFGDASIAADLFTWAYMQSAQRYAGFCLEGIYTHELVRR